MSAQPVPKGNTYDKYGTRNPIEKRLMAGFMRRLDDALPTGDVRRVLEVGTGEGRIAERVRARYPDALVIGLDLPDPDLAAGWAANGLTEWKVFGSAERLPFGDRSFDLVLGIEMLEHVAQPDVVLAEITRVARGHVVLTVPWEPWWRMANVARGKYLRRLGNTPGHVQHWGRRSFSRLVSRHLRVRSVCGAFPWTLVAAARS